MPLNNSGPISIGGSTTGQSINLELGRAATATSSLNESALRTLANIASGTISLSNFYGKSSSSSSSSTFTWTARTGPTSFYNVEEVYDSTNSRLLSTQPNSMYYTSDGLTWTAGTYSSTFNQSFMCVKAGDGYFFSGHLAGILRTSATGINNWTNLNSITTTGYTYDVEYSGSQYIYCHSNGIYTSTTRGSGYVQRLSGVDTKHGIARNPSTGRLIAFANAGYQPMSTRYYSSDDNGTTWTLRATVDAGVASSAYGYGRVVWFAAQNCFVFAGGRFDTSGSVSNALIYKISSDGLSYTNPLSMTGFVFNSVGVDTTNGRVVAVGSNGRVYTSLNATTWTANTTGTTSGYGSATWMPNVNRMVVLGYQNSSYLTGV